MRDVAAQSSSSRDSATDAELAARFERDALPLLDCLYRGALVLTGDRSQAVDLLQGTMMNAYRQLASLPESINTRATLYRAMTDAYLGTYRSGHDQLAECPTDTTTDGPPQGAVTRSSTAPTVAQAEALESLPTAVITKALHALDLDTRMAVYYADVEGFSYKEIADITNRSVSAVMPVLCRGRHRLRHLLLAALGELVASPFLNDAHNAALAPRATPKHAPLNGLSEGETCAGQLDWFDREIVRYVLLWAPHGEMWNEDVYPAFGMTVEQLVDRFRRIVVTSVPGMGRLAMSDRELLDKGRRQLPRIFGEAR
jgi:RNA polymerase sigma-70 factor, ECF subfamily